MQLSENIIKEKIEQLGKYQAWNHAFDFGNGITTPVNTGSSYGKNINKWKRIELLLKHLLNKEMTVLDVGSNDGFFSIQMAELSKNVLGLDIDEKRIEKAEFAKEVLNVKNVTFKKLNILDENDESQLGNFDVCTCLGVLHRLPDPFKLLLTLAKKSDILVLEWKTHHGIGLQEASLFFSPAKPKPNDPYGEQYFLPSFACVEKVLEMKGFKYFRRISKSNTHRALLVASRRDLGLTIQLESQMVSKMNNIKFLTKGYLRSLVDIIKSGR